MSIALLTSRSTPRRLREPIAADSAVEKTDGQFAAEGANRQTRGTQLRDDLSPDIAARAGDEDP
jgi:hypothetical protein